ncbi:MAG: hypothetical protein QG553_937 [Patescibacteria group bacterium]|nr:hypothetical protein [Patescibacteria group bacterium]
MDQYKISQTPGSKKKPVKKTAKVPKRRQTKSLSPQLVLGGVVVTMVLILGGVVWARYFNKGGDSPAKSGNAANVKSGGGAAAAAVPEATFNDVTTAINNNKPSDLKKYYAKTVKVIILKTNINQSVTAAQVENLISNPLNSAQTPWNWHPAVEDLAAWQSGPYGQYFGDNTIVGISPDGTVISIHIDDNGQIDTIFVAPVGDLTGPTTPGSTDTTTPSDNTTPSTPSGPVEDAD